MGWRDYKAWWDKYELSSLKDGQTCPEALLKEIGDDAVILSSARPRAIQTAGHLGRGREVKHDAMFNEAPLPPPRLGGQMRPKNWNKIARLLWMLGHSGGEEHVRDAKRRAAKAAMGPASTARAARSPSMAAARVVNALVRSGAGSSAVSATVSVARASRYATPTGSRSGAGSIRPCLPTAP